MKNKNTLFVILTTLLLQIASVVHAQQSPDWKSLNAQAMQLYKAGKYQEAVQIFEEAKNKVKIEFGINHENYANTCSNLAILYTNQGLYAKAEPLYIDAKRIYAKLGRETSEYATSCNNLAILYYNQSFYAKAEPLHLEAKEIYTKLNKKNANYASTCIGLANLYKSQGLYAKAEPLYVEAREVHSKLEKKNPDYAGSCISLANLYKSQGLYVKAEPLYIEAREIYVKFLDKKDPSYATSCNNLADLYSSQGFYDKANPLYIEAKEIREKVLGKEHPDYATSCNNLAILYDNQGFYAKAELLYIEAKEIREKVLGKEHPDYATSCNNLAGVYQSQGLYNKAELLYIEAKAIDAKILGKNHPYYANSCNNLAFLYRNQGLYNKAEPLQIESKNIIFNNLEKNSLGLSEKERKAQWEKNFPYFSNFYLFAIERCGLGTKNKKIQEISKKITTDWFDLQLLTKGLLANGVQKMQKAILNGNNPELKETFEKWKGLRTLIANAYNLTVQERHNKGIEMQILENDANELEKKLSRLSADFAKVTEKTPTWTELRKKLQPNEVAVEIIKVKYFKEIYYVSLIISSETREQPEIVVLQNGKELENKWINLYRNSAIYKKEDVLSYQYFWQNIWQKVQSISPNVQKIYYSPDGVYNQLNINTLYNSKNKKYILDEVEIQQVSNLKDILSFNSKKTLPISEKLSKYEAFLIGRPSYKLEEATYQKLLSSQNPSTESPASKNAKVGSLKFSDLLGTEREVRKIDSLLRSKGILTQTHYFEDATEEKIKAVKNVQIVHIATHGFFSSADTSKKFDDPMLRSGLILAGVNNYAQAVEKPNTEDGVLTALEAQNLSFDDTEVAILSACQTGLGDVSAGEGVYGLQRALKVAGAKTLIMSLWNVNDDSGQELMTIFYENWLQKRQSKRDAFKNAQIEIRAKYKNIYNWGVFVLIGE